jgi:DNA-directed RNA polymerase specialized sigma24 family protein
MTSGPNLKRLATDRQLVQVLAKDGFQGPLWDEFADQLARYGMAVITSWIRTGTIFVRLRNQQIRGPVLDGQLRAVDMQDAEELAAETIAEALKGFRKVLQDQIWSAEGGSSLKSFFLGQCLIRFPNVYRRWHREETQRFEVVPLEESYDGTDGAPSQHLAVGSGEDPAGIIGRRLDVIDALKWAVRNDRTRVCLVLRALGYTNQEIADWFNETEAAIEGVFYRHNRRFHDGRRHSELAALRQTTTDTKMDEPPNEATATPGN